MVIRRGKLSLVVSNRDEKEDGFISWQRQDDANVVWTLIPGKVEVEKLNKLTELVEGALKGNPECQYDFQLIMLKGAASAQLSIRAPLQIPEELFMDVVRIFKKALRQAGIIMNPLECPLPPPKRTRTRRGK